MSANVRNTSTGRTLQFVDEADAINTSVAQLKRQGVRTIVVTIHQGLRQAPTYEGPTDPNVQGAGRSSISSSV